MQLEAELEVSGPGSRATDEVSPLRDQLRSQRDMRERAEEQVANLTKLLESTTASQHQGPHADTGLATPDWQPLGLEAAVDLVKRGHAKHVDDLTKLRENQIKTRDDANAALQRDLSRAKQAMLCSTACAWYPDVVMVVGGSGVV